MEEQHQRGVLRPLKNTHSPKEDAPTRQKRDHSCYYGLRQNPKKTTHKSFALESSEPRKKILFRCGECGKGFRYEKCLSNHQAGAHLSTVQRVCEESIKSLCGSFSLVRKKKRSSRVVRYKKTSFTTFLGSSSVFGESDEELEVAECLILLSKSSPKIVVDRGKLVGEATDAIPKRLNGYLRGKKVRRAAEFEYGFLREEKKLLEEGESNEINQQLVGEAMEAVPEMIHGYLRGKKLEEWVSTLEASKEPASFLGGSNEIDQQKQRRACGFDSVMISGYETWKEAASFLGDKFELGVGALECSESDDEIVTESSGKGDAEHQCRLCSKVFSSYQALGGHQTSHRMSKSKSKKSCREESVELDDDAAQV
ncbi:unnamed protein product [Brassica rapa]|uniref:C2H2-type domain-containing protein n=1 Tax=Brassica campestris TaxID=3711 RepID=A0A3P6A271_BRACM|nr:unnamed protein product [Brassica rapa]VDC78821.1 unnamed protein product [Brassica rapa]